MAMEADKTKLKRISVDELKVGMFIVNLGASWISHPFLRNQLKIDSPKKIEKLKKHGIQEVYIDPQRGLDLPSPKVEGVVTICSEGKESNPPAHAGATFPKKATEVVPSIEASPSQPSKGPAIGEPGPDASLERSEKSDSVAFWEGKIGQMGGSPSLPQSPLRVPPDDEIPFIKEIHAARAIKAEAETVVRNVINEARLGKSIESDRVKRAVNSMAASVLRNRDALASLTRMKSYDEYIFVHSLHVCILSLSMARHLSLPPGEMEEIGIGALLHDVGKVKIDPHVLNKPETLSEKEWVEVRKHPIYGMEIMEESKGIPEQSKQLAFQHHERYNGTGYPSELKGEAISLGGQITGIIDYYDAVTTDRPFQKAIAPHEATRQLYEKGLEEFNRFMVEKFIQCIGIYPFGTFVLLDTEELGIVCGVKPEMLLRPNVLVIYQTSKMAYPQPFLADLTEKADRSSWYKRSIIMPLQPEKWNVRIRDYLGEHKRTPRELAPAI
jgi:putative nucleotidyltransferase with HDIG domain